MRTCRGFTAMSFRDLACDVAIKSASMDYHFPTKHDLGEALVKPKRLSEPALGAPGHSFPVYYATVTRGQRQGA